MTACGKTTSALIVAHPGHEVRVSGWYGSARPRLFVLTEGSRSGDRSRLRSAQALAERAGATLGSPFGLYRDREVYAAILARDPTPFIRWTADLADALVDLDPAVVVTDGWQLYNVAHDLTHVMTRVAVRQAAVRLRRAIDVVEFAVVPRALGGERPWGSEAFRVTLDNAALARKHTNAEEYGDLSEELQRLIAIEGRDAQRIEVFRSVVDLDTLMPAPGVTPPYERYGEQRVADGMYREVIRWTPHVRGVAGAGPRHRDR